MSEIPFADMPWAVPMGGVDFDQESAASEKSGFFKRLRGVAGGDPHACWRHLVPSDEELGDRLRRDWSLDPIPVPDVEQLFARQAMAAPPPRALVEAPVVEPACALCGRESGFDLLYRELPLVDTRGSQIVSCPDCGFVFLSPRQKELSDSWWNAKTYLTDCLIPRLRKEAQIDAQGFFDANRNWRVQRAFVAALEALDGRFERRVLDVGSSFGGLVHALGLASWQACGIEPSEHVATFGRAMLGIEIELGTFEALAQHEPVPCIVMTEVLEHCFEARKAMQAAYQALLPGGLYFVSVPNFSSPSRVELGAQWGEFVSDHFSHFTCETLGKMLVSEGFEGVKLMTADGFPLLDKPLPGPHIGRLRAAGKASGRDFEALESEHRGPGLYAWAFRPEA